ncbi:MAG: DNA gyrase inhibitor YacG [Moraxellaceae bacterium]|nr:MAG: DNA gyrase inhibitor YacG [Moraxellaceae bacterium]
MKKEIEVECPECKKKVVWDSANPSRPFCSERCKLLDLGAWADGSRAIPEQPDGLEFSAQNDEPQSEY